MTFAEFEILTGQIFAEKIKNEIKQDVTVYHQKAFTSPSGNKYNVDISFTFEILGLTYLTIVECKYWNSMVSREKVGYLKSIMDDIKANKGIVVSKRGFQKGAIKFARTHNIALIKIRADNTVEVIVFVGCHDLKISDLLFMMDFEQGGFVYNKWSLPNMQSLMSISYN